MPDDVWNELDYTCIHAAVLFADIQNSVLISSALSLTDYDRLVNAFQAVMLELTAELRAQGLPIGATQVSGDQLSIFFYDANEVERNWQLDGPAPAAGEQRAALVKASRASNEDLVYSALKAAVIFKNLWLAQQFNIERVVNHHSPFEVSIGINYGRVFLRNRADGQRRIEGYAVNLAKRIESASRQGRYSFIMFGQDACETLRSAVKAHTQLRQRVFFERHDLQMESLKGVMRIQPVYELKFCHRIPVPITADAIAQHESIFAVDPTNIWSYYQLVEHHGYSLGDWDKAYHLASRAHVMHPRDEKVKLDLANYHLERGELQMSLVYCRQALALNQDFDLAYEKLALIANTLKDMPACIDYLRQAVSLSPGSAVHHLNLGFALIDQGYFAEAVEHLTRALAIYPAYAREPITQRYIGELAAKWDAPASLRAALEPGAGVASADAAEA